MGDVWHDDDYVNERDGAGDDAGDELAPMLATTMAMMMMMIMITKSVGDGMAWQHLQTFNGNS